MLNLKNISLRRKQLLIIMLTCAMALLLACAAFITYEVISFRTGLAKRVSTTADIISDNCQAALDFSDPKSASEVLASLKNDSGVVTACIYNRYGDLFAAYHRDSTNTSQAPVVQEAAGGRFAATEFQLYKPIIVRGERIGTIYLAHDLQELNHRVKSYVGIGVLVLAASLLAALILSSRLQRVISGPILELGRVTRRVATEKNYSLRATKGGKDEIGELVDGFNDMLAEIQARDFELQNAKDMLERRVQERTSRLAESLSMLNATLESTTDGILVVNSYGKKVLQNQRTIDLWKIPLHIASGDDDAQLQHVMNMTVNPEEFEKSVSYFRSHPEASGQDEIRLKDGTIMERIAAPIVDKDGRNHGRIWTFRDITQRRNAESALRQSEALYESLVNQMPAGIYRKNAEGRFVFVNRRFCEMFQNPPEHFLGRTVSEVLSIERNGKTEEVEAVAKNATDQHKQIMETGKQIEMGEEHLASDGTPWYLHVVKAPVFDSTGKVIGTQGIQFEVTRQKQMEAELAYERDLFTALMNNVPDSIYFKDLKSRFIRVSRSKVEKTLKIAIENHLARHPGEDLPEHLELEKFARFIIGKSDADFLPAELAAKLLKEEEEIIQTCQPVLTRMDQSTWANGKSSWYLSSKLAWRDRRGEVTGTFGITKDITPMKEAEAALETVHRELLTASRQAGMAEVASNVLHNVGNVLNSVNVSATLAADMARRSRISSLPKVLGLLEENASNLGVFLTEDPKGRQILGYLRRLYEHLAQEQQASVNELESLRKNIEHIKEIVTMQQSYAKMSGLTEIVKVSDLVEDSLRMNEGALRRHEVKVLRQYEPVPAINVEKHKVLQILVNLIRNAKYACDEGAPPEKLVTIRITNGNERIKISVMDNGIGIPTENLTRIFNHGFTTRASGHGFGLHSGALAAREMGGSLMVYSAGTGQGATFTLELPATQEREKL